MKRILGLILAGLMLFSLAACSGNNAATTEATDWEYIQDYLGWSYFRKPIGIMNEKEKVKFPILAIVVLFIFLVIYYFTNTKSCNSQMDFPSTGDEKTK